MLRGKVDAAGKALLEIRVAAVNSEDGKSLAAWIDTGFTGDLALPLPLVVRIGLKQSGVAAAVFADGSNLEIETFAGLVQWFEGKSGQKSSQPMEAFP